MKIYILIILSYVILLFSCTNDNIDSTFIFEDTVDIDTTYVNSGEMSFDYNGSRIVLFNATGYVCDLKDTMVNRDDKNYQITNAEFIETENIILLEDDDFIISYATDSEILFITIYLTEEQNAIRRIMSEPFTITIEESENEVQATWSAMFEKSVDGGIDYWEPIGKLEGSFFVPKVIYCE